MLHLHLPSKVNRIITVSALSIIIFTLSGCMGTINLSHNITNAGHVEPQNIIFPELDDAWQKEGQFVNQENFANIHAGISKDELYQLIGRPHFSESNYAREWDYILKFYNPDNSIEICQYKVIFDDSYHAQEFYWRPNDCYQYLLIQQR